MTETQTPDCRSCGDTGFVPPFMDPCNACGARMKKAVTPLVAALSDPAVGDRRFEHGSWIVWSGTEWKKIETVEVSPAEYASGVGWVRPTDDLVVVEPEAFIPSDPVYDDDDEAAVYKAIISDEITEGLAPVGWDPPVIRTDDVIADTVKATKTSKETFADLEAACDGLGVAMAAEAVPVPKPDYASGYGEAGIYSDPSISYGSPKPKGKPLSEKQGVLLARLCAERGREHSVVATALDEMARPGMTAARASKLIDLLLAIPADPKKKADRPNSYDGICKDCGGEVLAKTGVIRQAGPGGRWVTYHKTGECLDAAAKAALFADRVDEPGLYKRIGADLETDFYRVRHNREKSRLYGELITAPAVKGDPATFTYNARAMTFLRKTDRLTWAEAHAFGVAYGACIACGRTLSDNRSLVQGYGATCGSRYHWPLVTAKQAEAIIEGVLSWDDVVSGSPTTVL